MDSINLKNGKATKHIIIKRKNKNNHENQRSNLTIFEKEKLNIFNEFNINTEEKRRNKNNFEKNSNNSNFLKLFPLQRPKIKINVFPINNNNKRGITISSEKNNNPISCKVHKSKSKKIKRHINIASEILQNKKHISFNSNQSENNYFNNDNTEEISENKNMNFLNYFDLAQHNNLKILNERLDDLTDNKKSTKNSSQCLNYIINGNKINYKKRNIIQKEINNINEYKKNSTFSNIYKKKSIQQKYSFSKIRTHTNSFSEISNSTIEQKDNKQIDPKIFNQLIKNKLKHKKLFKFIPKSNNFIDKNNKESFYTYNYNNKNSNSISSLSSIPSKNQYNKKFINKISIDLEKDDINIYKNNYYIYNYINKNSNTYNINNIQNPA